MLLVFNIEEAKLINTYKNLQEILGVNNTAIFEAMEAIAPSFNISFSPPVNQDKYNRKHIEIERIIRRYALTKGQDLCVHLYEKIWENLRTEGIVGIDNHSVISMIHFQINAHSKILYDQDSNWIVEWKLYPRRNDEQTLFLKLRNRTKGGIVPRYVVEFINTAIMAFKAGMYSVAMALSSIALEATLKDTLITKGYYFKRIRNQPNPKYVGGLGKAIDKARNVEGFLSPDIFPKDLDSVVQPVRNKLIHLSGDGFKHPLPQFDDLLENGGYTLKHFVENNLMVFDLLRSIIDCANDLYGELRDQGHLIT